MVVPDRNLSYLGVVEIEMLSEITFIKVVGRFVLASEHTTSQGGVGNDRGTELLGRLDQTEAVIIELSFELERRVFELNGSYWVDLVSTTKRASRDF